MPYADIPFPGLSDLDQRKLWKPVSLFSDAARERLRRIENPCRRGHLSRPAVIYPPNRGRVRTKVIQEQECPCFVLNMNRNPKKIMGIGP